MDSSDSKRWLFVLSAVMAFLLSALIYVLFVVYRPEAERASLSASPAPSASRQAFSASSQVPATPPTQHLEETPPAKPAADETVLCGYGRTKNSEADRIREAASRAADTVLDALKSRLAASKDPRETALGLYMQGSRDSLVALASGSGDPQVYALAFLSCQYNALEACAVLSARQWAAVEPDNGIPWLLMAGAAARDKDKDARNQAVIRASATQSFDERFPDFLGMLQWPEIRKQAPQTRSALGDQLMGMHTSLPTISYMPFIQFCSDPSVEYAIRTSACRNLTETLLRGRTVHGFSTGVRLAELTGWPRDEVNVLREKKSAYQSALSHRLRAGEGVQSECEDLAKFDQLAADYSRLGELGVARKYVDEARANADVAKLRR
jgi:hypothetical protein